MHIESDGIEIAQITKHAGKYCASYGGEIVALLKAIQWIEKLKNDCFHQLTFLIATDIRSPTDTIKNPDWKNSEFWMHEIWKVISRLSS